MQRVCANNKVLIEKYPGNLEWATLLPTPFAVMSLIMLRTTKREARRLVLKEPGLDEFFGPTNFVLKKIYLQRLHDPFLKDEYKARMDTISSCRTRFSLHPNGSSKEIASYKLKVRRLLGIQSSITLCFNINLLNGRYPDENAAVIVLKDQDAEFEQFCGYDSLRCLFSFTPGLSNAIH
ncbi:hypothetical protein DAPPUDRAFT_105601 [Daphnia pulex]|uniref:Uncharacterized protein n=1 Tax=Daphnia pulex TaxID=6669 RepID=E9GR84_DAPPU|nr:hypothetical protein DAPPUDRAFT_105601 [Daphnia pulex]|eukprot:EFX77965.1 hypothetical protein DAPPUDRAFT_105601 [Daphnia pulex]